MCVYVYVSSEGLIRDFNISMPKLLNFLLNIQNGSLCTLLSHSHSLSISLSFSLSLSLFPRPLTHLPTSRNILILITMMMIVLFVLCTPIAAVTWQLTPITTPRTERMSC